VEVHIRDLRYFAMVAEELHFTRAAERLYITQPGLSKQIAHLERSLGVTLLVRDSSGISLTPSGEALLPHARQIVEDWSRAEQHVHKVARDGENSLTVGFIASAGNGLLRATIGALRRRSPDVGVHIRRADWSEEGAGIVSRLADVALLWVPSGWTTNDYSTLSLYVDPLLVALWRTHPLATRPTLTMQDLANEVFLVVPEGSGPLSDVRPASERPSHVVTTVDQSIEAIESEIGVGLMPASLVPAIRRETIAYVPLVDIEPLDYVVAWREDDERTVVRDFVECCRQSAAELMKRDQPNGAPHPFAPARR